jgi:hypothetical protein
MMAMTTSNSIKVNAEQGERAMDGRRPPSFVSCFDIIFPFFIPLMMARGGRTRRLWSTINLNLALTFFEICDVH